MVPRGESGSAVIIDTMVMVYALLDIEPFGIESRVALSRLEEFIAPASIEAELLNVFWKWGTHSAAQEDMSDSFQVVMNAWTELIPLNLLWKDALHLAFAEKHSTYDTLFIIAARMKKTKVLTYDKRLLSLFPDDTITVSDFIHLK